MTTIELLLSCSQKKLVSVAKRLQLDTPSRRAASFFTLHFIMMELGTGDHAGSAKMALCDQCDAMGCMGWVGLCWRSVAGWALAYWTHLVFLAEILRWT